MTSVELLPQTMTLTVQPAPLPKNYHFAVGFLRGWQPPPNGALTLHLGAYHASTQPFWLQDQDKPGTQGFNLMLERLLHVAQVNGLWGQNLAVTVLAGSSGGSLVARSNSANVALPVVPLAIQWPQELAFGAGDQPLPQSLAPGQGRRVYYPVDPYAGAVQRAFYVTADNRLEDLPGGRGFDRFSFWLATYAMAPKYALNVTSGDLLAAKLRANMVRGLPPNAPLQAIAGVAHAAAPPGVLPGLMWTAQRVVVVRANSTVGGGLAAHEFDLGGLRVTPWTPWLAAEPATDLWSYRSLTHPPAPIWGPGGLA